MSELFQSSSCMVHLFHPEDVNKPSPECVCVCVFGGGPESRSTHWADSINNCLLILPLHRCQLDLFVCTGASALIILLQDPDELELYSDSGRGVCV